MSFNSIEAPRYDLYTCGGHPCGESVDRGVGHVKAPIPIREGHRNSVPTGPPKGDQISAPITIGVSGYDLYTRGGHPCGESVDRGVGHLKAPIPIREGHRNGVPTG